LKTESTAASAPEIVIPRMALRTMECSRSDSTASKWMAAVRIHARKADPPPNRAQ
jgi:hypothetical protein